MPTDHAKFFQSWNLKQIYIFGLMDQTTAKAFVYSVEPYSPQGPDNVKTNTLYRCTEWF